MQLRDRDGHLLFVALLRASALLPRRPVTGVISCESVEVVSCVSAQQSGSLHYIKEWERPQIKKEGRIVC